MINESSINCEELFYTPSFLASNTIFLGMSTKIFWNLTSFKDISTDSLSLAFFFFFFNRAVTFTNATVFSNNSPLSLKNNKNKTNKNSRQEIPVSASELEELLSIDGQYQRVVIPLATNTAAGRQ